MSYKDCETEKEAEELCKQADYALIKGYCPVILDNCNTDCMCRIVASKRQLAYGVPTKTYFRAQGAYCNHPFICGAITVE